VRDKYHLASGSFYDKIKLKIKQACSPKRLRASKEEKMAKWQGLLVTMLIVIIGLVIYDKWIKGRV